MNAVVALSPTGYSGYFLDPPRRRHIPGRRKISGWKKKLDALLSRSPTLSDENPIAVVHVAECAYIKKLDRDCFCPGRERETTCRRYDTCLEYAIAHDWPGFSCVRCDVDDLYSLDELRAQAAHIRRLWRAV